MEARIRSSAGEDSGRSARRPSSASASAVVHGGLHAVDHGLARIVGHIIVAARQDRAFGRQGVDGAAQAIIGIDALHNFQEVQPSGMVTA